MRWTRAADWQRLLDRLDYIDVRKVHGVCELPEGYEISILPPNAIVSASVDGESKDYHISASYNFAQITISLLQLAASSITLYKARGDQLNRYGYAAFGLTVLPYIIMSVVNLVGNLICPNYDSVYLIASPELEEARGRGGEFDGTIGKLVESNCATDLGGKTFFADFVDLEGGYMVRAATPENSETASMKQVQEPLIWTLKDKRHEAQTALQIPAHTGFQEEDWKFNGFVSEGVLIYFFAPIPFILIACLTHFHAGSSTKAQRVWAMTWLVFNSVFGFVAGMRDDNESFRALGWLLSPPAIGGLVVVGQMLGAYGSCVDIASGI